MHIARFWDFRLSRSAAGHPGITGSDEWAALAVVVFFAENQGKADSGGSGLPGHPLTDLRINDEGDGEYLKRMECKQPVEVKI